MKNRNLTFMSSPHLSFVHVTLSALFVECMKGYYVRLNNKGTESRLIPVANWRNISHYLDRSSYDCRRQYMKVVLDRDLERVVDIWTESEMVYLRQLVDSCGTHWADIARELGRKPVQCSNSFNNFYQISAASSHSTSGAELIVDNEEDGDNDDNDNNDNDNDNNNDDDIAHIENNVDIEVSDIVKPTMTVRKIVNRFSFWDDQEDEKLLALGMFMHIIIIVQLNMRSFVLYVQNVGNAHVN